MGIIYQKISSNKILLHCKFDARTIDLIQQRQIMSFNTTKITVFNEDKEKEEDVKLFYSTITDNVGITCGEQEVFLTQDQFKALAYLMRRCFYTRDILDGSQNILDKEKSPYTVYSSRNEKKWELEVEKNRYD